MLEPKNASSRRALLVSKIVAGLLVTLPPAAAYAWGAVNYLNNADLPSGFSAIRNTCAARQYNKVWRPIGYTFKLQYSYAICGGNGSATWMNANSNPFVVNTGANRSQAVCGNISGYDVYPVTCQTTE
jgi:hypothetical protein